MRGLGLLRGPEGRVQDFGHVIETRNSRVILPSVCVCLCVLRRRVCYVQTSFWSPVRVCAQLNQLRNTRRPDFAPRRANFTRRWNETLLGDAPLNSRTHPMWTPFYLPIFLLFYFYFYFFPSLVILSFVQGNCTMSSCYSH